MVGLEKINHTQRKYIRTRLKAILYAVLFSLLIPSMLLFQMLRSSIENLITNLFEVLMLPEIAVRINNILEYSGIITLAAMILIIVLTFRKEKDQESASRQYFFFLHVGLFYKSLRLLYHSILENVFRLRNTGRGLFDRNVAEVYHDLSFLWSISEQGTAGKGVNGLLNMIVVKTVKTGSQCFT